ncbi:hypothetical protein C2845_PM15G01720 [Panicum miliaceum]|uniref:Uncharacterized protein n=1 Tax=Panicum miliaceum TaxID=4540 RepID=A0A3L6Q6J8_PANMI|nr:hypothetical protein C2845_PM15G01720 [Panicum miliaceum]
MPLLLCFTMDPVIPEGVYSISQCERTSISACDTLSGNWHRSKKESINSDKRRHLSNTKKRLPTCRREATNTLCPWISDIETDEGDVDKQKIQPTRQQQAAIASGKKVMVSPKKETPWKLSNAS